MVRDRRSARHPGAALLVAVICGIAACAAPTDQTPPGAAATGAPPAADAATTLPPPEASKAAAKATASAVAADATPDVSAQATGQAGLARAAATGTAVGAARATSAAEAAPAFATAMASAAGEVTQLGETARGLALGERRSDVERGLGEVAALLATIGQATEVDTLLKLRQAVAIFDGVVAALHDAYRGAAGDTEKQSIGDFIASIELARARVAGTMHALTNLPNVP